MNLSQNTKLFNLIEIILVFTLSYGFIQITTPFVGNNLLAKQGIVWLANLLMLILIWVGTKIRKQPLSDFGITFGKVSLKKAVRTILISILVMIAGVLAFAIASVIMANFTEIPERSDLSQYEYLQNNVVMLIVTLFGVYIVSSFGEEVIYRAFLINRLTEIGLDSRFGKFIVVLISATIFGLAHYEWGPMGIVQTGFMGLVFSIFYYKLNKKIWILVLAHAYMDTLLIVQMYLASN